MVETKTTSVAAGVGCRVYVVVAAAPGPLDGQALTDQAFWQAAEVARVDCFHAKSSSHRPVVTAQLLYDAQWLYLRFQVDDRYVRVRHTQYQDPVCVDSCVEFFVQPKTGKGYFNFEVNGGGTLHLSYITDPTRTPRGFAQRTMVAAQWGSQVRIWHSLPALVEPEITRPTPWAVALAIPLTLLEHYVGSIGPLSGQRWRVNFYKCADDTSHPHWAAWNDVGPVLNFHQPAFFGEIMFAQATAAK